MRARPGRAGIAAAGLALLALGVPALLIGPGLLGARAAARPVVTAAPIRTPELWIPIAAMSAALCAAGLLWLAALARTAVRRRRAAVDGATRMAARAAGHDLDGAVRALPGVRDVRVRLTGSLAAPRVVLDLTCDDDADLGALRDELAGGPLVRYRAGLGVPDLAAVVRFRLGEPR